MSCVCLPIPFHTLLRGGSFTRLNEFSEPNIDLAVYYSSEDMQIFLNHK